MEKELINIEVKVLNEIAYKKDSNWGNYACMPTDNEDIGKVKLNSYGNMACVGLVQRLTIGQTYELNAELVKSPTYGYQYKIINMKQEMPSTIEAQKAYLQHMMTERQLTEIYKVYGDDIDLIDMFKNNTLDYSKIHGLGEVSYKRIREKVVGNLEMQMLLGEFPMLDYKILVRLKSMYDSIELLAERLRENPYIMTDLAGIGFKTADTIALQMGIDKRSDYRIHSCIRHTIKESEFNGDTYIKKKQLLSKCYEMLAISREDISNSLSRAEGVIEDKDRYALEITYNKEKKIAEKLLAMSSITEEIDYDPTEFVKEQEEKYQITLTDQQRSFFTNFKESGVNLLIGYAGCGKSMIQKLLINLLESKNLSYVLLSPTGKASKVLSKYTERNAWTIHKRVGIIGNLDEVENKRIQEDVIIVDEVSMVGVNLAYSLLSNMANPNARIVFVGDDFQLPSVEAGSFLRDMINSKIFRVTKLDIVFRQKEGGILDIVTQVREGRSFVQDGFTGVKKFGNNCLLVCAPQEKMVKGYQYYFLDLNARFDHEDILLLSPTKKSKLGTFSINNTIQEIVNPSSDNNEISLIKDGNNVVYRCNDIVINTVNTYGVLTTSGVETDIMNGDTGVVKQVNAENRSLIVQFDKEEVLIDGTNLDKLLHAHCITMHKSQGSSSEAILSITDKSHTYQLNANLIYTAWSRAEEFLVILTQAETINRAIKKKENIRRNTFLEEFLKSA